MSFFKKARNVIKGHKFLKDNRNLQFLNDIKNELSEIDLKIGLKYLFINYEVNNASDIVKQYLALKLKKSFFSNTARFHDLIESILIFYGRGKPVAFPLPTVWLEILNKNEIKTNSFVSAIYWIQFILLNYLKGCYYILQTIITFFDWRYNYPYNKKLTKTISFDSLNECQFPSKNNSLSHDIFTWFNNYKKTNSNLVHNNSSFKHISYNSNIKYNHYFIPPLTSFSIFAKFLVWSAYIVTYSFIQLLLNKWWYPLLLMEIVKVKRFELQKGNKFISEEYYFYSEWVYRPIWTYYLEEKLGKNIFFYFYSTNSQGFKTNNGYKPHDFDWRLISWPVYLVWNNYQKEFIQKYAKREPKFLTCGPVYFQSKIDELPSFPNNFKTIVIFDIPPFRPYQLLKLGLPYNYHTYEICCNFIDDMVDIATRLNLNILLKRKRKMNSNFHDKRYHNHITKLLKSSNNFFEIDYNLSAHYVISQTSATISFPFTSTALISRHLKIPSCYYDPTGLLFKDDIGSHGIKIFSCHNELSDWLKIHLNL